jgi:ubiquinone/menaquinone biosynthesis C-methylase UbiE
MMPPFPGSFASRRQPEPEAMDDGGEAVDYGTQADEPYLRHLDGRFVARALRTKPLDVVVDVGTGPGQIPVDLAAQRPALRVIALDLSLAMLALGRAHAARGGVGNRVWFVRGNGESIPLSSHCADLVICNSTLHHFADPVRVFDEMHRVLKPGGQVLIRDLRRPALAWCGAHVAFFGRHYRGRMRELFGVSVRAAYTVPELRAVIARSRLAGTVVSREGPVHLVAEGRCRP